MLVVELGRCLDLLLEQLERLGVEVRIVQAEDLQGILGAVLGRAELDLGGEARSERLSKGESVESSWHFLLEVRSFV